MRTYEALYVVSPEIGDDDIQTVAKGVEDFVTKHEGAIVRSEIWGRRKLAYPVKKFTDGNYVLLRFTAAPDFIRRLENHFRLSEPVIRYLVTHFDDHTLRLEAEQQKNKDEELRAGAATDRRGRGRDARDDDEDDDEPAGRWRRSRGRDDDESNDDNMAENE